jgi:hypothetical protein
VRLHREIPRLGQQARGVAQLAIVAGGLAARLAADEVRTSCTRSSWSNFRSRAARMALRSCSRTIRRTALPTCSFCLIR